MRNLRSGHTPGHKHCRILLGLVFFLSFNACTGTAQEPVSDFYNGLQEKRDEATTEAIVSFEKALYSSNAYIAAAAAAELMRLAFTGTELSPETMACIRQNLTGTAAGAAADQAAGSWARALKIVNQAGTVAAREELLSLLLSGGNRSQDEAALYALREWRLICGELVSNGSIADDIMFTAAENAAINGKMSVSRSRYGEALIFFRIVLYDSPELFFRYPDLLSDLGRTFQYTVTGNEGIDLFLEWEQAFTAGQESPMLQAIPAGSENMIRFRLLFFSGRIARQRGNPHIELFEQALPFAAEAPDEQSDACIWYILNTSVAQSSDATIQYLENYLSLWYDDAYFFDVMDKLSRELVLQRNWGSVLRVFALLKDRSSSATAKFAWIIGRAMEEGFFSPENISRAGDIVSAAADADIQELIKAYKQAAYNVEDALYYRFLGSVDLDEPFLVFPAEPPAAAKQPTQDRADVMQFLLGFFENDAIQFASPYIRAMEKDLSPGELRRLAEAQGTAGQYRESLRSVSLYAGKGDYQITRQDMELWYPRPFQELVEQYAQETDIDPALLFALIRTESAFISDAVSHAGAVGLTQLMPATAEETAARIRRQGGPDYTRMNLDEDSADTSGTEEPGLDLRNPAVNIHIGAAYLSYLNGRMEDPLLALLAYNGGMTRVRRWREAANRSAAGIGYNLPVDLFLETVEYPETRNYGRSVTAAAAVYRELYYTK